jgi:uncharacterized membrane protein
MGTETRGASALFEDRRRRATEKLGANPRLIGSAALVGIGTGALIHRILVTAFEHEHRLFDAPGAPEAALRTRLLSIVPWVAIALGIGLLTIARRRSPGTWSLRRAVGLTVAFAGFSAFAIGALEMHVFRTIEEGWKPRQVWWDIAFHGPGEVIAMIGWYLLPGGHAPRTPRT